MEKIADWLINNALQCPFKKEWGVECAGCGIQRSIALLLKGDITGSIVQHPPLVLFIATIILSIIYIISRNKTALKLLPWAYTASFAGIIINFALSLMMGTN